jgi:hypothetical protein
MTNGEEEINGEEQVPTQPIPEAQPTQPISEKKSSTNTILIIVGIIAICCVGAAVVVFTGALTFDDWFGPIYSNETIGGHVFKIPIEFEKDFSTSAKSYVQFKNDKSQFIRILDMNDQFDLYSFALVLATELGVDGNRVYINGTPAYKYNTVDTDGSGQSMYTYAINLQGDTFVISLSRNIQNPEEFLANITSNA